MESMCHLVLEKQKKNAIHGVHVELWSPRGVHENSMGQGKVHAGNNEHLRVIFLLGWAPSAMYRLARRQRMVQRQATYDCAGPSIPVPAFASVWHHHVTP